MFWFIWRTSRVPPMAHTVQIENPCQKNNKTISNSYPFKTYWSLSIDNNHNRTPSPASFSQPHLTNVQTKLRRLRSRPRPLETITAMPDRMQNARTLRCFPTSGFSMATWECVLELEVRSFSINLNGSQKSGVVVGTHTLKLFYFSAIVHLPLTNITLRQRQWD